MVMTSDWVLGAVLTGAVMIKRYENGNLFRIGFGYFWRWEFRN